MACVEWELERFSTVATLCPRRLRRFPASPTRPLSYEQYRLFRNNVLDALIDQKTTPTYQLAWKLDAVVGRRTHMNANRQEAGTRNVRQKVR